MSSVSASSAGCWWTFELLFQTGKGLVDLVDRTNLVERKAHDAALLCQGLEDALTNPPTAYEMNLKPRVSSKRWAALIKPRLPSLIKSGKDNPWILVLLGDGNHETEVGLGHLFNATWLDFLCDGQVRLLPLL